MSPLLFAVAIEPLALALRQNADIKGSQQAGLERTVSFYIDNMLLYISQPLSSLSKFMALLTEFGKTSGYKVIIQNSKLMPVGTGTWSDAFRLISF